MLARTDHHADVVWHSAVKKGISGGLMSGGLFQIAGMFLMSLAGVDAADNTS